MKKQRPTPKRQRMVKHPSVDGFFSPAATILSLSLNDEAVSAYDLHVGGKSVSFSSGKAETPISPGDHTLSWSIVATPGVTVTLAIDAPPEAKWTATITTPASGRWDGIHLFSINETRAVPSDCYCTGPLRHSNPPPAGGACWRCGAPVVCT